MKNVKNRNTKRRLRWNKQFVLLASIAILILGTIGGSLAYLVTKTEPVENVFDPGKVDIEINEPGWSDGGSVKQNVTITNNGNAHAKVRAKIVVTWQDENNNIYPQAPEAGTDYTIVIPTTTGWSGPDSDGWYAFDGYVAPDGETGELITTCSPIQEKTPVGYHLVVDIIAEAIQNNGITGTHPWGISQNAE